MKAWLGLGANLGDRTAALSWARGRISTLGTLIDISPIYETEPVGGDPNQHLYLNAVVSIETEKAPLELLDDLLSFEREYGRTRVPEQRNAPRVLDIDILLLGQQGEIVYQGDRLEVPHPRMHERRFVLEPLLSVSSNLIHPVKGCSLASLLNKLHTP